MLESLKTAGCAIHPTGSRYICNPAPTDTDDDYLVICNGKTMKQNIIRQLKNEGFEHDTGGKKYKDDNHASDFSSFSKGELNLIVTSDAEFAERHITATFICKELNLLKKGERVMVFRAVLYGQHVKLDKDTDPF